MVDHGKHSRNLFLGDTIFEREEGLPGAHLIYPKHRPLARRLAALCTSTSKDSSGSSSSSSSISSSSSSSSSGGGGGGGDTGSNGGCNEGDNVDGVGSGEGSFVDFVASLLSQDPENRPSAELALTHPWMMDDE